MRIAISILALFLSSCASVDVCTVSLPIAGEKVAQELKNVPFEGYENFWEWLARLNKRKQLEK